MTLTEFISEIHTDLASYSDSGDIDNNSINLWVISCLRKLGLNICDIDESIVKVTNSQAVLPQPFRALKLALKVLPFGCNIHGDREILQTDGYIYREYIENPAYFDEVNQEYIKSCNSKIITEKITIGQTPAERYYSYEWLSLVKGINKSVLSGDCININPAIRAAYPQHINISGNTLHTNFREGYVYLQYYALPNQNGEVVIPELTTLDIFEWIKTYVKVNIAENIIANNKNPQGLAQLYPGWLQSLPLLKVAAMKEARFYGLSKGWNKKYKAQNKAETASYNLPNLRFSLPYLKFI